MYLRFYGVMKIFCLSNTRPSPVHLQPANVRLIPRYNNMRCAIRESGPLSSVRSFFFGSIIRVDPRGLYARRTILRHRGSPIIFFNKKQNRQYNISTRATPLGVCCSYTLERFSSGNFSAPATSQRVDFEDRLPVFFCTRRYRNNKIL